MKKKISLVLVLVVVTGLTVASFTLKNSTTNAQTNTSNTTSSSAPYATQERLPVEQQAPAQPTAKPATPSPKPTAASVVSQPSADTSQQSQPTPIPDDVACTNSIPQSCTPAPPAENPPSGLTQEPMPYACTASIPQTCYYDDGSSTTN